MGNKVTLKQIAQEVGLSPSSVSLVLNNRPCRISEENRKRIKEVAARNHYVPNQIARSLVMRESRTLGLIVPNIESRFFASLAGSCLLYTSGTYLRAADHAFPAVRGNSWDKRDVR